LNPSPIAEKESLILSVMLEGPSGSSYDGSCVRFDSILEQFTWGAIYLQKRLECHRELSAHPIPQGPSVFYDFRWI